MSTSKLSNIENIKSAVTDVCRKFDLSEMWLFGSYAKGSASEDSDIDFMVKTEDVLGGFKLLDVKYALEDSLKKQVDLVTTGSIKGSLIDGVPLGEVLIYTKQ
jgi:uncharacterized protein